MEEYTPQKRGISHIHWSNPTEEIYEHPHQGLELVFTNFLCFVSDQYLRKPQSFTKNLKGSTSAT